MLLEELTRYIVSYHEYMVKKRKSGRLKNEMQKADIPLRLLKKIMDLICFKIHLVHVILL